MKIRPMGAGLFHADWQAEGPMDRKRRTGRR